MATRSMETDLDFGNVSRITGLPAASASGQPVVLEQLNAAIEKIDWKDDVVVAAPTNVNLSAPGATIDAHTMTLNDRFLAPNQTTSSQNGIYIWNGASTPATRASDGDTFGELENAVIIAKTGSSAGVAFRQTQVGGSLETDPIIFTGGFGATVPPANETTAGKLEVATQGETDAGTDDARAVTPLKLATWSGRSRFGAATIGDGSALSYNVDHNFGTRNVIVQVYRNSGNYDTVDCEVRRPTTNRVTLLFTAAPASNSRDVVIQTGGTI